MSRYLNRELSWLDFNERVLDLAAEPGLPLLERVKFIAISSGNLDEFFQVRIAALKDQVAVGVEDRTPDGRTPLEQLEAIGERVRAFVDRQERIFTEDLVPALRDNDICIVRWSELDPAERSRMATYYADRVYPVLTPLAVDPGHPFPYISNLALSLAATVADPSTAERRFVRLKIPKTFPRFVPLGDGRFLPAEELIAANLSTLFTGMVVEEWATFRVTRNADLALEEEEADDLLQAVELELRKRRFNRPVRLEVHRTISDEMLGLLVRELDIDTRNVTRHSTLIDLSCLFQLHSLDRPDLKDRPWIPITAGRIHAAEEAERSLFDVVDDRALLLHHPYESFASSVEAFIAQAADDPAVQTIKMTLYRAGGDSPILRSLIRAAERGVQVAVLVEIKARFDEANNVQWARRLERAGVHVVYGMVGLKTHSKVVLVVRDDGDRLRRYCHIGTGNYNSKTARLYEDLGLFTCNPAITEDLVSLFNYMTGRSRQREYQRLLVAPVAMKRGFIDLVEREIHLQTPERPGRIIAKMNQLEDRSVTDALYRASQAGVQVDLIVRGFCCLRPGVPGLSENIRVISVIGRFLEHSRIFWFSGGRTDPLEGDFFIGSADWMYRNLNTRVEVATPIETPPLRRRLWEILQIALHDRRQAWDMHPDGTYRQRSTEGLAPDDPIAIGTHQRLMAATVAHYEARLQSEGE